MGNSSSGASLEGITLERVLDARKADVEGFISMGGRRWKSRRLVFCETEILSFPTDAEPDACPDAAVELVGADIQLLAKPLNKKDHCFAVLPGPGSDAKPVYVSLGSAEAAQAYHALSVEMVRRRETLRMASDGRGGGSFSFVDGARYYGEMRHLLMHGRGTLIMPSGESYKTVWQRDAISSDVEYHHPSGLQYRGSVSAGAWEGHGVMRNSGGDRWTGTWYKGALPNGEFEKAGVFRYTGQMTQCRSADGTVVPQPHGQGSLTFAGTGDCFVGEFEHGGVKDGPAQVMFRNGNLYEGQCESARPHGAGTLYFQHSKTGRSVYFRGNFAHGVPVGTGWRTYDDSDEEYQATYKDGMQVAKDSLMLAAFIIAKQRVAALEEELAREQQLTAEASQRLQCAICSERDVDSVFTGCGHRMACMQCGPSATQCPACGGAVGRVVQTYDA